MTVPACDVAIVGAGPYGLATAAHLRTDDRLEVRVFGEPMSFWEEQMPVGMFLRSPYVACNISDPGDELTLDAYQAANGNGISPPSRSIGSSSTAAGSSTGSCQTSTAAGCRASSARTETFG